MRTLLLVLLAAMTARAGATRLVPVSADNLAAGRGLHLAAAKDTIPLCGEPVGQSLVKTRDIAYGENFPELVYGKFRLGKMEFTDFIYLRRSGDSLHFTAVPGKAARSEDFYPLCIRLQDIGGLYERVAVQERPDLSKPRNRPPSGMTVPKALGYTGLAIVAGCTVGFMGGMMYAYATDKTGPDAAFGYAAVGGGIGMVLGFHLGMQYMIVPAIFGSD